MTSKTKELIPVRQMIKFDPDKKELSEALRAKVPQYLYRTRAFDIKRCIKDYTSNVEGYDPVRFTKENQYDNLAKMITEIKSEEPYTACISSDMDDLRAKLLAYEVCRKGGARYHWHPIMGGYNDPLIPKPGVGFNPEMLVIYNILHDADQYRKQKLRDLLEYYSDIPKIVITTGGDPLRLFIDIGFPLDYHVWIKSSKRQSVL